MKDNIDYSGHRTRAFQLAVVLLVSARWLFPSPTSAPDQEQAPVSTRLVTQEELVKELEKEFEPMPADCKKPIVRSPDNLRVACAVKREKKWGLYVNGVPGPEYDQLYPDFVVFSPDGQPLAYVASRGTKILVVLDGVEQASFDSVSRSIVFSPDSKHLAYPAAKDKNTWFVVVDGAEQAPFYLVARPWFSPDSKHMAYSAAKDKNTWVVVVDGAEQTPYHRVIDPVFSPDSKRLTYKAAKDKNTWVVVVDGAEQTPYQLVTDPVFSPDSKRLGYVAAKDKKTWVVVVDGAEQPIPTDPRNLGIGEDGVVHRRSDLVFSPDGKRLAYNAVSKVVVDGVEQPYSYGGDLVFSPDSQHLAYAAILGRGWNDKIALIVDGKVRSSEYSSLTKLQFSPDSKRLAYVGCKKDCEAVIDDKHGQASDWVGPVFFSEDSRHYAYAAAQFRVAHNPMVMVSDDQVWPVEYGNVFKTMGIDGIAQLVERALPSSEAAEVAGTLLYPLIGAQGKLVAWIEMENPIRPDWERVVVNGRRGPDSKSILTEKDSDTSVENGLLGSLVRSFRGNPPVIEKEIEKLVAKGLLRPVPGLSPDGEHFAYVRRFSLQGRGKESVVLDDQEGKPYDAIGRPQFTGNNTVAFTAIDGRKVLHVTLSIR
jgi:WD40 repeat protein